MPEKSEKKTCYHIRGGCTCPISINERSVRRKGGEWAMNEFEFITHYEKQVNLYRIMGLLEGTLTEQGKKKFQETGEFIKNNLDKYLTAISNTEKGINYVNG